MASYPFLNTARILAFAAAILVFPASVVSYAQQGQPAAPAPRFDIQRFDVTGNTLLTPAAVEQAVAPYTGKGKDFADVQRALEALELAYRNAGYGIVQVQLPEQDITRGVVQFRVVEQRIGRVTIEGNKFFDNDNIRHSLPSVKEGATPNSREMSRDLQQLADHPTKQTGISLRSADSENRVDVNVRVSDEKPWRIFFTADNTGTSDTGYLRAGVGFQHSNLWNKDHVLTAQYVTSPTKVDKVTILGVGYHMPLYSRNSSVDLVAGYSDVDSGTVQGLFNVSGSGLIAAARWNYYLPKWNEWEHKLSAGLDYRAFENNVVAAGVGLVPDITIHPVSLTYSAVRRYATGEFSAYISGSRNIPGGNDGEREDFACPRPRDGLCVRQTGPSLGANPNYNILRFGASVAQALPHNWQLRVAFTGQQTRDALVPGEQFGIGGPDSVRGYAVRDVASDRGYQAQTEVYTPDVASGFGLADTTRLRFLVFFDAGSVQRNKVQAGETEGDFIKSFGLGARLSRGKSMSLRVDVAQILQATANRPSVDSLRVTAAAALIY